MQRAKYVDNGRRQHMASVVVVVAVAVAVAAVALRVYDCVNKLTQGRKQSIDTKAMFLFCFCFAGSCFCFAAFL